MIMEKRKYKFILQGDTEIEGIIKVYIDNLDTTYKSISYPAKVTTSGGTIIINNEDVKKCIFIGVSI